MYNLSEFAFSDMVDCGAWLRRTAGAAASMEEVADLVVSYLHQSLRDDAGDPACALVRCFVTLPFGELEPDLQEAGRNVLGREPSAGTKSLTLLATAGQLPAWNDRRRSVGHQAIPLAGEQIVAQSPMVFQLITQFGLDVGLLLEPAPAPDLILDLEQRTYNVFHVLEAPGSPYVPAQDSFVVPFGIRSVLGFGGILPGGNLVAFILFSRCTISPETASLFRTLALTAKLAVMPFARGPVFARGAMRSPADDEETLRGRVGGLEQLLDVYESTAAEQAHGLELAIIQRKKSEAAVAQARDQAVEASRAKSDFLAVMSHEIRTPMNGVIGLTGLLLDGPLSETQRHHAEGVRASGEALLGIINSILDFSKIEAGRLELEAVDFDLHQALDDVAGLVAETARAKGLELVVDCRPELPTTLTGDVGRLRQILLNLTSNAVKFTHAGEVVLRASLLRQLAPRTVVIRFDVIDTGIGIDPGTTAHLFDSFSQADASTTRRFGGTGLGLAICRRLAEAMGGAIGLDSRPGQGADFWVDLPFTTAEEAAAPPGDSLAGRRVLVVDDNHTNRLVLAGQLRAWDVVADVAEDAEDALLRLRLAAATASAYDAAVIDMEMPGTDGMELARMVRADADVAGTPLLLLSSVPVEADAAARAGFAARLMKPARVTHLCEALVGAIMPGHVPDRGTLAASPAVTQRVRGTVLVVDDHTINQDVAKGILRKLGYRCDLAGDGVEALAALERRDYDAGLMDCRMPRMDGFEATAEIRRREAGGRHVPIVAMTASALVEDRARCLAAGMDDYVSKPVKDQELQTILDRLVVGITRGGPEAVVFAAPVSTDENGVLDLDQFERVRELGEVVVVRDLVERYVVDAASQLADLRRTVEHGDREALRAAAHGLKGSSATMGATTVAAACHALELVAVQGGMPAPEALERVAVEVERAAAAMRSHLS